jgi:hypothetical protein
MKQRLLLVLFTILQVYGFAKKQQYASFYVVPAADHETRYYYWSINGKAIDETSRCTLPIHYPDFDTLIIAHGDEKRTIITRFEKKHIYELTNRDEENDFRVRDMTVLLYSKHSSGSKPQAGIIKVIFNYGGLPTDTLLAGTVVNSANGRVFKGSKTVAIEETIRNNTLNTCFNIRIGTGTVRREIDIYNEYRYLKFYCNYDEDTVFIFDEELVSFEYNFFNPSTLVVNYDHKKHTVDLHLK